MRVNYDAARINGVEFNSRARFSDQFSARANLTYVELTACNGLPPNIEGGIKSRWQLQPSLSTTRAFLSKDILLVARQRRLSSLDPSTVNGIAFAHD